MNLVVAKELPRLAHLDVFSYKQKADQWATEFKRDLREAEKVFHRTPHDWKNDLHFFRLGHLCYFVDVVLGIRYREDQKDLQGVIYTDPNDLFLTGVMDTRRGTCANLTALYVALAWRMRWPVSLACVDYHIICRYDDGKVIHNIEASNFGAGGFKSPADDFYMQKYRLPTKAVRCGSDLRAVTPREMLGMFVGFRGRHLENVGMTSLAEPDYLLARHLFPRNRQLHYAQGMVSVQTGMDLFEEGEVGHPKEAAAWVRDAFGPGGRTNQQENDNGIGGETEWSYNLAGKVE